MYPHIVLVCGLVASALASPVSLDTRSTSYAYVDKYDDLSPGVPVTGLQSPVGIYNGLEYLGWLVGGPSPGELNNANDGVIPQSSPNQAIAPPPTNLTNPAITINYPGSPYSKFDLIQFYFGCSVADQNGVASVAQGCVVDVVGFYANGDQTGVATYGFSAPNPTNAHMVKAILPITFLGVQNVTFGIAASASTAATTTLQIDNLAHINWKS